MSSAVRLENVSKHYRMGAARRDSLAGLISRGPRRLLARGQRRPSPPAGKLALDGVSLDVSQGESYALIGSNGAGKSTALRIISRISPPSRGRVRVRGRVGALIEVSSGVHPELTGRENIWLYGSIIGMPRAEIRSRFDDIVEFSGLAASLDGQVKYYSSGMQLRLGFAIASHLEPDVFVVDEALAVGDSAFQSRCVHRMTSLAAEGTTLLFVSHHLPTVEALCPRAGLLAGGRLVADGPTRTVLSDYLRMVEEDQHHRAGDGEEDSGPVRVLGMSCHGPDGEECNRFSKDQPVELRIRFESETGLERPHVTVGVSDGRPGVLLQCSMLDDGLAPAKVGRQWECRLKLPSLPLRPRLYWVWCQVWGADGASSLCEWTQVGSFRIVGELGSGPRAIFNSVNAGALALPYSWDVRS
ncbi:MAG TPA: ABC transporter ATP-binding protein [Acidimicrobiales bacterium]|nr:ABC transporter ATP-binding protein [Acidimicrobiales bacterium]